MKIGTIDLGERPIFLAPMEDVTDISFRLMCKRFGADMVYTEFVSADALIRSVNKTQQKLNVADEERPVAIQIYGRDVPTMVEAAQICEAAHPDILDINFGCPVKRVAGKGAGAGMLRNIPLMLDITREVVKAVNIPVTVKTRFRKPESHHPHTDGEGRSFRSSPSYIRPAGISIPYTGWTPSARLLRISQFHCTVLQPNRCRFLPPRLRYAR